jgi:glycosyltransferase involved in cell wall biosynthesis
MRLGVPVVGVDSGTHRDVLADGGLLVDPGDLAEAVESATGGEGARLSVLAADRSRAFSWAGSAERVWGLHADL